MLMDAFVLACLATIGMMFTYGKLPRKMRRFLASHGILTDFLTSVMTYFLLGGTLTALTAGVMVGIFTSVILHVMNNPQDFLYLWDLKKVMELKLAQIQDDLREFGRQYRERTEHVRNGTIGTSQA
jgi:hypothetical protein